MVRQFFIYRIRDRKTALAWYDQWCHLGPLCEIISLEDIVNTGYNHQEKVSDLVSNATFTWSPVWNLKYPGLASIQTPHMDDLDDKLMWKGTDNVEQGGSVACIWESIRPHAQNIEWFEVVWFT
ncbi:uncharacterized protein [Rutidosis leptorrhynchoides]|uniref:uncharacterized protein n=1 Tax=Rutidosis leptorrhynchoides TaxID=125765 RepID=UPI003A98F45A